MGETLQTQVLVIGAGPAGATLALLLAQYGIRCIAVSRYRSTANTPRAHIFNQRAMEVLRDVGLQAKAEEVASDATFMQHITWSETLAGEEYGRSWTWGNKPSEKHRYEMASPCRMSDLPQKYLEPILVDEAEKRGAIVKFSTEFISFEARNDSVVTLLRDRNSGEEYQVQSEYLVGADGANSTVIKLADIPIEGTQLGDALNIVFRADLSKHVVNRPGILHCVLNNGASEWSAAGTFRMVRPWHEWVVVTRPAHTDVEAFEPTNNQMIHRLRELIGDDTTEVEILSTFRWTINDQVARTWQKGRILCIGDAVHRHPPANGLGSNTCISDAFNLAWKLAFVLQGKAGTQLLDTLTSERKPVGDAVVRRASDGMKLHLSLWSLLGLTPESKAEAVALLSSPDAAGREARQKVQEAFESTDLEFQALGIQMNQFYMGSTATAPEPEERAPDFSSLDLLKEVAVSTFPGVHLPHVWLAASGQSPTISTLDLCGHGRFTLLTGIGGECWRRAAADVASSDNAVPVACYTIGFRCDYMDCYRDWQRIRGVEEDGVVLVRPDHFVAWRWPRASSDASQLLQRALARVLSR